jgi:O-succinylbenzoate synthase
MTIAKMEIFRFSLPLKYSFHLPDKSLSTRDGYLIRLSDQDRFSFGEVAPLPGLHKEDLAFALQQIHQLGGLLPELDPIENVADLRDFLEKIVHTFCPSVRFGFETACLHLLSSKLGKPLCALLFEKSLDKVWVNALVMDGLQFIQQEAKELVRAGYRTIKVKVGRHDVRTDINRVRTLREAVGNDVTIRLDANRKWTLQQAVEFGKGVADFRINYIEEPTCSVDDAEKFYVATSIPVALDESLTLFNPDAMGFPPGVKAIVIKPGVVGGVFETINLALAAKEQGIVPVLSCAFFSGLSHVVIAQLAAGLVNASVAIGLDTIRWLNKDVLAEPFVIKNGAVVIDEVQGLTEKVDVTTLIKTKY